MTKRSKRGSYEEPFSLDMDADEALERLIGTDPKEVSALAELLTRDDTIDALMEAFANATRETADGTEFWSARELCQLLGYEKYDKFLNVIEKAKTACETSRQPVSDHFLHVEKMIELGKGAKRDVGDIMLTRYACYLVAQNGDPRKQAIAFAQTYFAVQARRQEIADEAARELTHDESRVLLRNKLKEHNKSLASAAKEAGVLNFANFNGAGLKGLYGGLNQAQVAKRKGLPEGASHLDYAGHEELAANYFKATQAEAKLRREGVSGQRAAERAHKDVGEAVRKTIADLGNTLPEDVAPEDHIREAQKRIKAATKPAAIDAPKKSAKAKPPVKKK